MKSLIKLLLCITSNFSKTNLHCFLKEQEARLNRRMQQLQQTIDLAENVNTQNSKATPEEMEVVIYISW